MGGFNLPVFGGGPTLGSTVGNVAPGGGFNFMNLFPGLVAGGFAGGAGALGSSGTTHTTGTTSSSGTGSGSSNFFSNPLLSGPGADIAKAIRDSLLNQYNQGVNLQPYQQSGQQQIAGQGRNNASAIANAYASRGLSYSPAAGTAQTQNILNTGNQQNQFLSQIPLLQHQLNQGNIQQLIQGFTALPYGTSGGTNQNQQFNQTQNQDTTQKTSTSPWAALLSGLGSGIAAGLGGHI